MPATLVSRLGHRNEFAEFKSVLNDARDQVMTPVDAEAMARDLVQSGGREYVEMVRELTAALANARRDLESANRRYDCLTAELARRGIDIAADRPSASGGESCPPAEAPAASRKSDSVKDERAEWEDWNRKFQSLLDCV